LRRSSVIAGVIRQSTGPKESSHALRKALMLVLSCWQAETGPR
jgi:hypothetical protein